MGAEDERGNRRTLDTVYLKKGESLSLLVELRKLYETQKSSWGIGTFDTFLDKRIQETYLQYVDVSPTYYCMVDANAEWEKFYLKRGNLDD